MAHADLCSAVFVLRPLKPFSTEKFLGRAAHKLFLLMLNQTSGITGAAKYAELADTLHELDSALPFTVSDLFQSKAHYWMRVTALQPDLVDVLQTMLEFLPGRAEVDGWRVEFALASHHDWAGLTTYEDFVKTEWAVPPRFQLTLDFVTPTSIKSVGVFRPFPHPPLIFRLLYERMQRLPGISLPFAPSVEHLELFAEYMVEVVDYQLRCVQGLKKNPVTAFCGQVTYDVLRQNDSFRKRAQTRQAKHADASLLAAYNTIMADREKYVRLVNLLAAFAFYSGIGSGTAQGMGMVRRIKDVR